MIALRPVIVPGVALLLLVAVASGFGANRARRQYQPTLRPPPSSSPLGGPRSAAAVKVEGEDDSSSPRNTPRLSCEAPPVLGRRRWIAGASATVLGTLANAGGGTTRAEGVGAAASSPGVAVPGHKAVVVLGANGGTGRECVSAVLASGRPCVAATRSGELNYDDEGDGSSRLRPSNTGLSSGRADVTKPDSILSLMDEIGDGNVGAVIFAASASVKGKDPGNDAFAVDCQGVINAAECCIRRGVPRLVIVSSGAVTRPDSAVYKLLNFVGSGIMEAKIQGEDEVRRLYRGEDAVRRGLGYTIVRPGGLTADPIALGPAFLEVNQGDDKSGRLSRADVAGICVACLNSKSAFDTTFECYETNTAKSVDGVGLSNFLRLTDPTSYKSGREGRGDTWDALLGGLKRDFV